jgi:hypothetical protein
MSRVLWTKTADLITIQKGMSRVPGTKTADLKSIQKAIFAPEAKNGNPQNNGNSFFVDDF